MIKKLIQRLKDNNVKTTTSFENIDDAQIKICYDECEFNQEKDFDVITSVIEEKIKKSKVELAWILKKQKKFIWLSLLLYFIGAASVILFINLMPISSVMSALISLLYILLGNVTIQPIANKISNSICLKCDEIENLKKEMEKVIQCQKDKSNNCDNIEKVFINSDIKMKDEEAIDNNSNTSLDF